MYCAFASSFPHLSDPSLFFSTVSVDADAAHIPLDLTPQELEARERAKAKAREKKKAQKQRQKERTKAETEEVSQQEAQRKQQAEQAEREKISARATAQILKDATQQRQQAITTMTDREKRALAAEKRLAAMTGNAVKCAQCNIAITKVPFERLTYKYCSIVCLNKHREALEKNNGENKTNQQGAGVGKK